MQADDDRDTGTMKSRAPTFASTLITTRIATRSTALSMPTGRPTRASSAADRRIAAPRPPHAAARMAPVTTAGTAYAATDPCPDAVMPATHQNAANTPMTTAPVDVIAQASRHRRRPLAGVASPLHL